MHVSYIVTKMRIGLVYGVERRNSFLGFHLWMLIIVLEFPVGFGITLLPDQRLLWCDLSRSHTLG